MTTLIAADSRPTIYDIAKQAGVHPSTVSRALGKPGRVSSRTEKLVKDAAAALNFTPNPLARALLTGRTGVIGLIVTDLINPSCFDIIRGAQAAAEANDLALVIAESTDSPSAEKLAAERLQPLTDGIVLGSPHISDAEICALNEIKPVVVLNRSVESITTVVPDVRPGVSEAVRHLASLGHRKIAYLSGPNQSWLSGQRWESLRAACEWTGREAKLIPTVMPTVEGGRQVARAVVASGATAALCHNDLLAIGLMQELQAAALRIPDDFSVIGCDNVFGSNFTTPTLSTIASPFSNCGAAALNLLAVSLAGTGPKSPQSASLATPGLGTTLIVRGSSGRLLAQSA